MTELQQPHRTSYEIPAVIHLPYFWVTLAHVTQEIANLFGEYFQGVYERDDSQEDFVVDDGVENSSTNSLIQLEEETVGRVVWL
jgi:hypothetical protein